MAERQRAARRESARSTAASASSMKAGTAATGTETSCLIEPPAWLLHLAELFADAPERLGLFEAVGDGGIARPARARRRRAAYPPACRAGRSRRCEDSSISTYQGCGAASGSRQPAAWLQHAFDARSRGINSKLVTPPPARSVAMPSRSSAASGEGRPTKAVSTERGRGTSRSTAAVITPSVPSAPMNRFFRS